ncbi:hypothetical protein ACHAW5_001116 [Stephanodiscus triporus]|uniref:very-long-chain (3R)-3-hydroxyacyl-CoA dehydratase n=1 Tax=Stephanodiscus triporus TaxID=2934178 RepID=A0ABD3P254_9STRA
MESLFALLNAVALLGWSSALLVLLTNDFVVERPLFVSERGGGGGGVFAGGGGGGGRIPLIDLLLVLELICLVEVCRIAVGKLKGNLVLGSVLHVIRFSCLFLVLPNGLLRGDDDVATRYVLYAWSITEVCRYPMYLFPKSSFMRRVRLVAPIFTFPVGCAAEACGAYRALMTEWRDDDDGGVGDGRGKNPIKLGLLGMVILINGVLGPTMAYPALLKKGLPELMRKADKKGSKGE